MKRMNVARTVVLALFYVMLGGSSPLAQPEAKRDQGVQHEESRDYFSDWLRRDVIYIVTPEERKVFEGLTTTEEKEQFIEQFWFRRDPDPKTVANEFREEHYRRLAYANERFASGIPGWRTDRGRIYIIHGPPAEIESFPTGGTYERPLREGGGLTATFPFEIWRYREIEGIGEDVELEFVDSTMSGEYRLSRNSNDKDALLNVPGAGLTKAEELGLSEKRDRLHQGGLMATARDNPFERYETYAYVQRPKAIKYDDLKELVAVNVTYQDLPAQVQEDYLRLNDHQALVPITVEVANQNLTFDDHNGNRRAIVAVYGVVTSLAHRVVAEFEDDLAAEALASEPSFVHTGRSVYQKLIVLDLQTRYKLELVIKDLKSGRVGVFRRALVPPAFSSETLSTSSVILSDRIRPVSEAAGSDEMFLLGDLKVEPNVSRRFARDGMLAAYLQVYNAAVDRKTLEPALSIDYRIMKKGQVVEEVRDEQGESARFVSEDRIVVTREFSLRGLQPGKYQLNIQIRDRVGGKELSAVASDFSVIETEPSNGG